MKKTVQTVNIHEAKTQLSKLVDQAVKGDPFIIAKAGKPLVKVTALDAPPPREDASIRFHGRADGHSRRFRHHG